MAARFLNRIAGLGVTVGVGGLIAQECIYDGALSAVASSAWVPREGADE